MNEMERTNRNGRAERSMARNRVYALLAIGFRYPEANVFPSFADGSYADEIAGALELCTPELVAGYERGIASRLQAVSTSEELASDYLSAFETNMPTPSVSLYESSYHQQGNTPALLLELKAFYRNFGLTMSATENDLEDALCAELEFMQFLTAKETLAEEGLLDRAPYVHAQRDFLENHLCVWVPALRDSATSRLKAPFYLALVELLADFVSRDVEWLRGDLAGCEN